MILLLLSGLIFVPAHADKVITNDGKTIEGLIRDENEYYVHMDVRGTLIDMPRNRIRRVIVNTKDENVRSLLDRALEAMSRNDVSTARTLLEQARQLRSKETVLLENLNQLDREITELERSGGSAEDRRLRARVLLEKANNAYDKIRNEEANQYLIQALRMDPTYEDAHNKINQLLTRGRPDLLLAAEYFCSVMWPDDIRIESPVIGLLPEVYVDLAERYDTTSDLIRARRYAEMLRVIAQAYRNNPVWKDRADDTQRAVINRPVEEVLSDIIRNNMQRGEYEFAYQKLIGWADPQDSAEVAVLFAQALVGSDEYTRAMRLLTNANENFPENHILEPQMNALRILIEGDDARSNQRRDEALAKYQQIFEGRVNLVPEIQQAAGESIAALRVDEIKQDGASTPRWKKADAAAMIARFGTELNTRQEAARVFIESIPTATWSPDVLWYVNRNELPVPATMIEITKEQISSPLAIHYDDTSRFKLEIRAGFRVAPDRVTTIEQYFTSGDVTDLGDNQQITIVGFNFQISAYHPALGYLLRETWTTPAIPTNVRARLEADGVAPPAEQTSLVFNTIDDISNYLSVYLGEYMSSEVNILSSHIRVDLIDQLLTETTQQ